MQYFGLYSDNEVDTFLSTVLGCLPLQHRGTRSFGYFCFFSGKIITVKDEGLVLDVFKPFQTEALLEMR